MIISIDIKKVFDLKKIYIYIQKMIKKWAEEVPGAKLGSALFTVF